jgi:Tol biopolymer transport system component
VLWLLLALGVLFTSLSSPAASSVASPGNQAVAALPGRIVFARAGGSFGDETLFVAKLDGTHRLVLPLPRGTLSLASGPFSPGGRTIAREGFDDQRPANGGIYITRASDGKILSRVTRRHFIPGDFSPDGKRLVLFSNTDGQPPPPGRLWVVNTNGTGLRRLTPTSIVVQCCSNYRWSPDDSKILFADADGIVWTIAPNGSKLTKVFKDRNGRYAITPTWSPDGSMIMFALDPSRNPFSHPSNGLFVVQSDGSGLQQVIGGDDFKREPVWVSG